MFKEAFNPSDPKYKRVRDLPKKEQENFVNAENGGFVRKEAAKEMSDAQKTIELANQLKKSGMSIEELFKIRTSSEEYEEARQVIKDEKTTTDILRERAVRNDGAPVDMDLLQEKAREMYFREHPEEFYLERLRKNNDPGFLNGIPRHVWENKKFVMEAVKYSRKALGKAMVWNEEIVLEALKHDGLALQYKGGSDINMVLEAVKQNPEAIKYASKEIKQELRKLL